ncbi:hypothetical protein Cfor_12522 [Coptotermes formosanus]|uniref:MRH domain-containing protein n=1 Tax=Coptotermes formosanus TaxID=36987 RepID=A0A6L2PDJ3_COPFO|nr:hypothetical protein Cfor_12522 [Coptotermes formosanus]
MVAGSQSQPSGPVLQLVGSQPCRDKNYSAEIYFKCSSVEEDPVLIDVSESCTLRIMWRTSAACPVDSNCVFDGINFISLRRSDYYEVEAEDGQKFLLNVCGPVRSDLCNASGSVTACEVDKNNSVTVIGWLHGYHMQRLQQKGVVLTYRNSSVTTEIQFLCNTSAVNANPKFIGKSGKTYSFELETPLACNTWPQECMVLGRDGGRIDLSPLRKSNGNWVTRSSSTGVQYHINVCGPLNPSPVHNCSDGVVGACRTDRHSSVSLGYISGGLKLIGSDTVMLEYTGGSKCQSGGRHSIRIVFLCSRVVGVPLFMQETADCVHQFFWETPVSCPSMVAVGQNCIVADMRYGNVFDLTVLRSLRGHSLTNEKGDTYHINVCGPLNGTCNGQEASVCLTTWDHKSFAIGRVNRTILYDNGALRFVLHGEGCKSGKNSSTVTIILLCRQGDDLGQPEMFPQGDGDCNFYYVWYTRAACPPHWSVDCSVMHDGKLYDLSPLSDSMSNHVVVYTLRNVKFLLNVCHSIVFGKDASCQYTSAACMVNMSNPNPTTSFTNIGDVGSSPYFEDGKLKLKYGNGAMCTDPKGPDHMSTSITFECDSTDYGPELLPGDVCVYKFVWRTPAACPLNVKAERPHEDDSCTVGIPGTINRVNLRALRNSTNIVADLEGNHYAFAVCGNLSRSHCGSSGVGVCQFKAQDPSHFKNAGVGNSHLHYSQGSISLEYTDGEPCINGTKRSTKIVFVCEPHGPQRVAFIDETDSCKYLINYYTGLACIEQVECSTPVSIDSPPISLTPLIRLHGNYEVPVGDDTVVYINVCRPLLPVEGLTCPGGSSACSAHLHHKSPTGDKSLGFPVGPVKGDKGKVSIMYILGSECDSGPNYSSKIEFECDPKSGQGHPEFRALTDDCQYQFTWKTSVTCEPFIKNMSVSDGQCVLKNEQVNGSMDLKTLGQHGMVQVEEFSVNLCSMEAVLHTSSRKSYGTLTSVVFDYQRQQVRLLFTAGASCSSTEMYESHLVLNCDRYPHSNEPEVLTKNDCSVVIEWKNAAVCELLVPTSVHSLLRSEDTQSSAVGLVVGLIVLVAVVCLLVLYFRKPANWKHFSRRVTSLFGVRDNGRFYYSRVSAFSQVRHDSHSSSLLTCVSISGGVRLFVASHFDDCRVVILMLPN